MNQQASPQTKYLYRPENVGLARTALAFLVFGGISFYFIYSPALNIPFAHHDQYRFFAEDSHSPLEFKKHHSNDSEYRFIKGKGRPIAAEIEFNTFKNVFVIKDLVFFRFITVFMIVISVTLIAVWLYYIGLPKYIAFLVSGSLFTLPGIQNFVCMANIPNVLAIFLAIGSSLILYRVSFLSIGSSPRKDAVDASAILLMSFLLLMGALFSYPALAYLFLLPPLTLILFRKLEDWGEVRKVVALHLGMLGFASIVYFLVVRYMFSPSLGKVTGSYQFGLTHDLVGKMRWFIRSVSIWTLNLWNIYLENEVAYIILIVICLGVLAKGFAFLKSEYFSRNAPKAISNALQAIVVVIGLVLAVNLPIILMSGGLLLFRIILAYSVVIAVILFFCLRGLVEALAKKWANAITSAVFCIVFAGSAVYANFNTANNALNSYTETLFLSSQLAKHVDDNVKRIHVILPISQGKRYGYGYIGLPQITDEFNMVSLCHLDRIAEKVRGALLQVMDRSRFVVVGCAKGQNLQECLKNASAQTIVVTYSETDEPIEMTPNTVVVNMNDLMQVSFERNRITLGYIPDPANTRPYIADSPNTGSFTAKNAFDGSTNTFWETGSRFPHWIMTDFGTYPKRVTGYTLQTGPSSHGINGSDASGRMPKDWRFEGSNDGRYWILIDTQKNQTNWKASEIRRYSCTNSNSFRYYRLYISAGVNANILRLYEITLVPQTDPNFAAPEATTLPDGVGAVIPDPNIQ